MGSTGKQFITCLYGLLVVLILALFHCCVVSSVKSDVINSITEAEAIEMLTRKSAQSSPRQPSTFATSTPSQERGTKTGSTRVAGGGATKNAVTKKSATRKLSNYQVFVQRAMKGRGLTMKEVSVEWKELSDDEKAAYAEEKPEDGDGNA